MISIVTTLYNSSDYVNEFHNRTLKAIHSLGMDYEYVYVNDGSPDNSMEIVKKIILNDSKVSLVNLSRNFGHHYAMWAGLSQAKGNYIYLIDCDLEEPPELINDFFNKLQEDPQVDVIYGVQNQRKGGVFEKLSGYFFFKVFNKLSNIEIPKNVSTVRLMKKNYVDKILSYKESSLVINGIFFSAGFNQLAVPFKKGWKKKSSYSLLKKVNLFLNSITSFSSKPLYYIFLIGVSLSSVSFLTTLFIVLSRISNHEIISGWTSLFASLWFIGGVIISAIGVLGLYVAKIFDEVKERPKFIIKEIITKPKK